MRREEGDGSVPLFVKENRRTDTYVQYDGLLAII